MKIHELGHVVLYVSNIQRSADFYRNTLGFEQIYREDQIALFSSGRTHHELLLIEVGGPPRNPSIPVPGLYHIGLKIGNSSEELKAAYQDLLDKGVTVVGAADHRITHSVYVLDPDNNEIELYADVSDEWRHDPSAIMTPARPLWL